VSAGRFAPSTTGLAHPGTLLSALLAWLDARSRGLAFVLRLDDADPQRCQAAYSERMRRDLGWFGLDWDQEQSQRERQGAHEAALDRLAERGLLYACRCSRKSIRAHGQRTPDGGWQYPGTCRERIVRDWRQQLDALRVRLPAGRIVVQDETAQDLSDDPTVSFGDPVLRRRDGAVAYQLSVIVDDHDAGVSRVIRGRDLAAHTATQCRLQELLDFRRPAYRHHFLLLEPQGEKLAKFHQSVQLDHLRPRYQADELCGILAHLAGLLPAVQPCTPHDLLTEFVWERVTMTDRALAWDGQSLEWGHV
jgi:glutamyl-Q tRNA(Asp) synthetase